jgi:hypothetical protein
MKTSIKEIREAIIKNCGGFEAADDAAIMNKWDSLTAETQKQYLNSLENTENIKISERKAKNVAGSRPEGNV